MSDVIETAPAGTVIRCCDCDVEVLRLVVPLNRGAVIRREAVEILAPEYSGDTLLCPNDPLHRGGYGIVNGERWYVR